MGVLMSGLRILVDTPLGLFLSRRHQAKLGKHILSVANGENNCDPRTNGEMHLVRRLKKRLKDSDAVVFDVGANVGDWTAAVAGGMGPRLSLYCFEPARAAFDALLERVRTFEGGPKIAAVKSALGVSEGGAVLYVPEDLAGTSSLFRRHPAAIRHADLKEEEVSVTTGDSFCRSNGIERIDFVKIDTEGNDVNVLRGFGGMISEGRIACLQFEYNNTWVDAGFFLKEAFEFLLPAGYRIGRLCPRGVLFLEGYDLSLDTFQYANYLAVRPEWAGAFGEVR